MSANHPMGGSERLLILGSTGFLGAHLVRWALGQEVAAVVACARGGMRDPFAEGATARGRLELHRADVGDSKGMEELFLSARPTACIVAAALSRMGACEEEPAEAWRVNVSAAEGIARIARAGGVRLVHVSTDLVFGGVPPRPKGYREQDETGALSVYGRTKVEAEARVLAANPEAVVCRLPLLFGDSMGRGLGASDQILADLERGRRPRLFRDELRSPLDVEDAARALLELAGVGAGPAATFRGLLHVAGPDILSRLELGELVVGAARERVGRAAGHPGNLLEPATRAAAGQAGLRPANVALDAGRAQGLLRTRLRAPSEVLRGDSGGPCP